MDHVDPHGNPRWQAIRVLAHNKAYLDPFTSASAILEALEEAGLTVIFTDPTVNRLDQLAAEVFSKNYCQHELTYFDREICPEPCGTMHDRCKDCGIIIGHCPYDRSTA